MRPNIPQWRGDFWEKNVQWLKEKPTHEQLQTLHQHVQDKYGKFFIIDLFVVLFGVVLDNMPDLPPLTPKKHDELFSQIIEACLSLSMKWGDEFLLRLEQGFDV